MRLLNSPKSYHPFDLWKYTERNNEKKGKYTNVIIFIIYLRRKCSNIENNNVFFSFLPTACYFNAIWKNFNIENQRHFSFIYLFCCCFYHRILANYSVFCNTILNSINFREQWHKIRQNAFVALQLHQQIYATQIELLTLAFRTIIWYKMKNNNIILFSMYLFAAQQKTR